MLKHFPHYLSPISDRRNIIRGRRIYPSPPPIMFCHFLTEPPPIPMMMLSMHNTTNKGHKLTLLGMMMKAITREIVKLKH